MVTDIPAGTDLYYDWCNPMVILLVLGMAVLGVGIFFGQAPTSSRRGRAREHSKAARSPIQPLFGPTAGPVDQNHPAGERRTSVRRKGKAVRVLACADGAREDLSTAWVMNRSRGGVAVVATREFAAGTVLAIRTTDAPDTAPWIKMEVRTCRKKGKRWKLGCQFKEELPWSVLLLLG